MRINVFGLGKVGSVMAILYASKGFSVSGFDPFPQSFERLLSGEAKSLEPGVGELIPSAIANLRVNPDYSEISAAEVSLVIVPTPSEESGRYELSFVEAALEQITEKLGSESDHIVVVKSTVLPGDLARISARIRARFGFSPIVVYNPEFIALGDILRNMLEPELVLVGSADHLSAEKVSTLVKSVVSSKPAFWHLATEEAELAKVALNSFVTMKISFANLIGDAASRLGSLNPSRVLAAIGSDARVGAKYLSPGMGFGGPCFPRDNRALAATLLDLGLPAELPIASDSINTFVESNYAQKLVSLLTEVNDGSVSKLLIIGAAYKAGTPEIPESQPLGIAKSVAQVTQAEVHIFDPLAHRKDVLSVVPSAIFHSDLEECLAESFDVIFVGLPIVSRQQLDGLKVLGELVNPWA